VYGLLRGLVFNLASTHQAENPRGFSEVGEDKQLLIAIVVCFAFFANYPIYFLEQRKVVAVNLLSKFLANFHISTY